MAKSIEQRILLQEKVLKVNPEEIPCLAAYSEGEYGREEYLNYFTGMISSELPIGGVVVMTCGIRIEDL